MKKWNEYKLPLKEDLQKKLSPQQYYITQEAGTEEPFNNAYWNYKGHGIYVDVVSGEPLFSSFDKFDSGCGWPSFTRPLEEDHMEMQDDFKFNMQRTEVRSRYGKSHLGHVFDDGPAPTGQRYCINSAAMRFVPVEDLEKEGLGEYKKLFEGKQMKGPNNREVANLAGGCFWGMEELIRQLPGVLETKVGYIGGKNAQPNYEQVKTGTTGHAEAVQVEFDPQQLSYRELLLFYFRIHDPTTLNRQGNDLGTQYRSTIFPTASEQEQVAQQVLREVEQSGRWAGMLVTTIELDHEFFPAEEYHQGYLQKHPHGYTCHYIRP